jgi:hypothetical protein
MDAVRSTIIYSFCTIRDEGDTRVEAIKGVVQGPQELKAPMHTGLNV